MNEEQAAYHLIIPRQLYQQVQQIAASKEADVLEVFKKFIKLGLLACKIEEADDAALVLREGERERELVLFGEPEGEA